MDDFVGDRRAGNGAAARAGEGRAGRRRQGGKAAGRREAGEVYIATNGVATSQAVEGSTPEGVTVYGYIRTSRAPKRSSRHQASSSPLGIESQRTAILAAYPSAVLFVDEFVSGRRASRPGLSAMLQRVKRGDLVITTRLDRIARGMRLAMALEHQLEDVVGARLVSLAGEGTSADGKPDPYAVFTRRIHQATAELQAAQAARTTADALAVRKRNGFAATGSPPWGYQLEDGKLVEHPDEQKALQLARTFLARCGSRPVPAELALFLNRAGARNRRGKSITRDTAARIIRMAEQTNDTTGGT